MALLAACSAPTDMEKDAAWRPMTFRETDRFTLHSPYDAQETAVWALYLTVQVEQVAELFDVSASQDLLVRLVPIEVEGPNGDILHDLSLPSAARRGARYGYTVTTDAEAQGVIVLYVPSSVVPLAVVYKTSPFRHELVHFFLNRIGLDLPLWLEEGIARSIQYGDIDDKGEIKLSPTTRSRFADGSQTPPQGTVDRLLSWDRAGLTESILADELTPEDTAVILANYQLSHAFALFLMQRRETGSLLEQLHDIAALTPQQLQQVEAEWIAWTSEELIQADDSDSSGVH